LPPFGLGPKATILNAPPATDPFSLALIAVSLVTLQIVLTRPLLYIFIALAIFSSPAKASHITGGEMHYTFDGMNNGMYQYTVTLKLFQRCGSGRAFPNPTIISIFDKTNGARINDFQVNINNQQNIQITNPDPCITNPPDVCYDIAYYSFSVSLSGSADGYAIASQVNYRINGITNLQPGSGNVGAMYTAEIPGTALVIGGPQNNSAVFTGNDLVVVCANNNFSYSFGAQDADGDELRYTFCNAYNSTATGGGSTVPPNAPPYPTVPYSSPDFDETHPLGYAVNIDPNTGLITGVAPSQGIYVVTVCVDEIRNGQVIARQRKDLQINIADCNVASASLLPEYYLCKNTMTLTITNLSSSPLIVTQDWNVLDNTNSIIHSDSGPSFTYTFPVIGIYTVRLVINRNQPCTDSTTSTVRVFPGFAPDFASAGICFTKPTFFTDFTTSVYGTPNSWTWDFGEPLAGTDVSTLQNPSYTYPSAGTKDVRLIATDTRGCRDTITKPIDIITKPPIPLAFRDTLICINDNLTLLAGGQGIFSWTPLLNIINANTNTPTVSPPVTTTYYVDLDNNGCKNRDSVKVNVVDHVTLIPMNDTIICKSDTIQLRVQSDGLHYSWAPAGQFINPLVQHPFAFTYMLTDYIVTATIGGCLATRTIRVTPVPYPGVNAGADLIICYNTSVQLNGSTDGSSWLWSPAGKLSNASLLNPVAYPSRTTDFVLTAYDTKGCPKPGRDTVSVTVLPKMRVSAGRDTAVITGQPLQLFATGGESYTWSPAFNVSSSTIANPVALFNEPSNGIQFKVVAFDENGCADSAYIVIKVFKTKPMVFVPTGFTPNNDGRNDLVRPVAVGIKTIDCFTIYNRWGQVLFTTTINGHGWDGKVNGQLQSSGTFVWMVKATDYTGKAYFEKGVVTLIR
jgi:gliding motility-associated-like protein